MLKENALVRRPIQPHGPEENRLTERAHRTVRQILVGGELFGHLHLRRVLARLRRWRNKKQRHTAPDCVPLWELHRGEEARRYDERQVKPSQSRHRPRKANLELRQRTFPLEGQETVASN